MTSPCRPRTAPLASLEQHTQTDSHATTGPLAETGPRASEHSSLSAPVEVLVSEHFDGLLKDLERLVLGSGLLLGSLGTPNNKQRSPKWVFSCSGAKTASALCLDSAWMSPVVNGTQTA